MDLASRAEKMARMSPEDRADVLAGLNEDEVRSLLYAWRFYARPKQLPPESDWAVWLILAGRGFGKTRAGAGWVHERAMEQPGRYIAMVARTPAEARDFMIDGPGGILQNTPPNERPEYQPSKRRITWPNGSQATVYSGDEPDQLRGFSGDTAWLDELAKYKYPKDCWDQLQMGMREASTDRPRRLITTTPRPLQFLRDIIANPTTVVVTGSSYENKANLDPTWFDETIVAYEGSRFGRQEIHAEILSDVPGALWTRRVLDDHRVKEAPEMERIVVGVDPAITAEEVSNETGIVVCGVARNSDGQLEAYVLGDWSLRGTPEEWARKAVAAYRYHEADRIVAEKNQGGLMVETTIRTASLDVPVKLVHATRGKYIRAEPISALYEQGRVHHVGSLPVLEDQMVEATQDSLRDRKAFSPDRVDALVWALADLFPAMVSRAHKAQPAREYAPVEHSWMGS